MTSIFNRITRLYQSADLSMAAANRLSEAYAKSEGKPEYHIPIGWRNLELVGLNLAGLYAADNAAMGLAAYRYGLTDGNVSEEHFLQAVRAIESDTLTDVERFCVQVVPNATWREGQPFREMATNGLGRLGRPINKHFNLLSKEERDKDMVQLRNGARIILELVDQPASAAA